MNQPENVLFLSSYLWPLEAGVAHRLNLAIVGLAVGVWEEYSVLVLSNGWGPGEIDYGMFSPWARPILLSRGVPEERVVSPELVLPNVEAALDTWKEAELFQEVVRVNGFAGANLMVACASSHAPRVMVTYTGIGLNVACVTVEDEASWKRRLYEKISLRIARADPKGESWLVNRERANRRKIRAFMVSRIKKNAGK